MALIVKVNAKRFIDDLNRLKKRLDVNIDKVMYKYRNLMRDRAKTNHTYNNQTGNLSNSHVGYYYKKSRTIKIVNNVYYGKFVKKHYSEDWIKNSVDYYTPSLKNELQSIPRRYVRRN